MRLKHLLSGLQAGETITSDAIEPDGEFPVYGGNGLRGYTSAATHEGQRILIGRQGALCGNVHLVEGKFWASEHAIVASPRPGVDARWLSYLLHAMDLGQYSMTVAQPGIGTAQVGAVPAPCPPQDEQRCIADFLDRETAQIDTLIEEQQRLIDLLEERRLSTIRSILTGGLEPAALRKNSGTWLAELPSHWHARRLGHIGRSRSGSGFPPHLQGRTDLEYPYFKVKHLSAADARGRLFPAHDTVSAEIAASLSAQIFPAGTIVYAKVGAALLLGRIRQLASPGCIDNNMSGFTVVSPDMNEDFVRLAMSTIDFSSLVNPGAVPSLSDRALMATPIPAPPLPEQAAIVSAIETRTETIDRLVLATKRFIALSKERRSALITAAVTGQINVREAA